MNAVKRLVIVGMLAVPAYGQKNLTPQDIGLPSSRVIPPLSQLLAIEGVDWSDAASVSAFIERILPSFVKARSNDVTEIWAPWLSVQPRIDPDEEGDYLWENRSEREVLEFEGRRGIEFVGDMFLSGDTLFLTMEWHDDVGDMIVERYEVMDVVFHATEATGKVASTESVGGDSETWSLYCGCELEERGDGGGGRRTYIDCKCDKTGGSKCTKAQCDDIKTCTTPAGPTGSCAWTAAA